MQDKRERNDASDLCRSDMNIVRRRAHLEEMPITDDQLNHRSRAVFSSQKTLPQFQIFHHIDITSTSHRNIKYSKWRMHKVLNIGK